MKTLFEQGPPVLDVDAMLLAVARHMRKRVAAGHKSPYAATYWARRFGLDRGKAARLDYAIGCAILAQIGHGREFDHLPVLRECWER